MCVKPTPAPTNLMICLHRPLPNIRTTPIITPLTGNLPLQISRTPIRIHIVSIGLQIVDCEAVADGALRETVSFDGVNGVVAPRCAVS